MIHFIVCFPTVLRSALLILVLITQGWLLAGDAPPTIPR